VVLLLALPLFYFLTKYFYAEELADVIEAMQKGKSVGRLDLQEDIIIGVMIQFALISFIISLSLFVTIRFVTKRLWRPFNDTLRKIEQFNIENSDLPVFLPTHIKEFSRLNDYLTHLMKKSKESYLAQKEFTQNASHELQTPLALMQGKLDLLLQEGLNESQSHIVQDMYQVNSRMSRLNKNLLLLAKIENDAYSQKEEIDLLAFVSTLCTLYASVKTNSQLKVINNVQKRVVLCNSILLESLINNLVVNAIRHSKPDSPITIAINQASLLVSNEAYAGALDKENLFERFNFSNSASRGNGLGLAIVKAICDYHHWLVAYSFQDNKHCFSVFF